jgi:UDP-glucose 4-epimerase
VRTTADRDRGGRRILITGIAGALAGRLALRLEADDRVEYVGGVDLTQPTSDLRRTEFVRADLRNPLVAKVVESTRVDTIVHMAISAEPRAVGGRARMKELNVIGTMQVLAAAQKAPRVRTVVLRSTTAVYGSHYRDPAVFREDHQPRTAPRSGYTKDVTEVEGYARGLGRRRPDVDVTTLRFANFIGPEIDTTITRYLSMPVIPTVLGYDPRLQLLHTDDALEVLHAATLGGHPGLYNVAGPGVIYLSQAARMVGRPTLPVPVQLGGVLAGALRPLTGVDFTGEQLPLLQFGRVADITRMRRAFGFEPRYSTRAALQQFVDAGRVTPLVRPGQVAAVERRVGDVAIAALRRAGAEDAVRSAVGAAVGRGGGA